MQISRQAAVNSFVACEEANIEDVPFRIFKITEAYKEHTGQGVEGRGMMFIFAHGKVI